MKKNFWVVLLGFSGGLSGAWLMQKFNEPAVLPIASAKPELSAVDYKSALNSGVDFVKASQASTPSVVFIKTLSNSQANNSMDFWSMWDFFGRRGPVSSSGSGVILTKDGYIVTNNHVIDGADKIEVILNNGKFSYEAKVIGTDPSSDLALLKIEAGNLPAIAIGNSDDLKIGEWVIAVGNPFNLTSTVTAGIVSAKGRNINIVNNQFPLESFIQTDAAINPGNSGGALVNINGELIGINTAIQSNTGSYTGYAFAIPSNIVARIVKDLIEHGEVQRGFTGMDVKDLDAKNLQKLGSDGYLGVYVEEIYSGGPAEKAGIKAGDLIISANGRDISSKSLLDEQVAYFRPGEKIKLILLRDGKEREVTLTLINREGNTDILKREIKSSSILGADFEIPSKLEKDQLGITSGVKVAKIRSGRLRSMGIPEGFIFTKLNGKTYSKLPDFISDLENVSGRIIIEGISPNGVRQTFQFYTY